MDDRANIGRRTGIDSQTALSTAMFLGFGLILLALLVAIDRQQWFELRPASGTAAAMFYASEDGKTQQRPQPPQRSIRG